MSLNYPSIWKWQNHYFKLGNFKPLPNLSTFRNKSLRNMVETYYNTIVPFLTVLNMHLIIINQTFVYQWRMPCQHVDKLQKFTNKLSVNKTPALAFTPPADEKKMGTICNPSQNILRPAYKFIELTIL